MRKILIFVLGLFWLLVFSLTALAAEEAESISNQNINENLVQIKDGVMTEIVEVEYDYVQTETMVNSILKAQAPVSDKLTPAEKRQLAYQQKVKNYDPPKGKIDILVTGYSSTVDQCDGDPFTTASGTHVHKGTMACPPEYPMGVKVKIDGVGTFVCEDRGGAIKGNHFDMWFPTRGEALSWGKRLVLAEIVK